MTAGLELKMSFDYYNYRRAPGVKYKWNWKVWEGARNAPPVCIVSLKPVMGWQLRTSQPKSDNTFPLHLNTQTSYRATGLLVSYQVGRPPPPVCTLLYTPSAASSGASTPKGLRVCCCCCERSDDAMDAMDAGYMGRWAVRLHSSHWTCY